MDKESAIHKFVVVTLIRIGIKTDQEGFDYLIHAVENAIKNPQYLSSYRRLLEAVTEQTGAKNVGLVEASINNSITYTHETRTFDFINTLYRVKVLDTSMRPSAAQVVRLIAEFYTLDLYKNDKYKYKPRESSKSKKKTQR